MFQSLPAALLLPVALGLAVVLLVRRTCSSRCRSSCRCRCTSATAVAGVLVDVAVMAGVVVAAAGAGDGGIGDVAVCAFGPLALRVLGVADAAAPVGLMSGLGPLVALLDVAVAPGLVAVGPAGVLRVGVGPRVVGLSAPACAARAGGVAAAVVVSGRGVVAGAIPARRRTGRSTIRRGNSRRSRSGSRRRSRRSSSRGGSNCWRSPRRPSFPRRTSARRSPRRIRRCSRRCSRRTTVDGVEP